MDLSFARNRPGQVTALPTDLAVLLVGVAARQAASVTAQYHVRFTVKAADGDPLRPASGAFHPVVAAMLTGWKGS